MTELKQTGPWFLALYLILGFGFILWGIYVQDAEIGEGTTRWFFWWALPGLAALPVLAAKYIQRPESGIISKLLPVLAFGVAALGFLAGGWLLWVIFLLAPEPGDSVYRWWVAVLILMLGSLFVMHYVRFGSTTEDSEEATGESWSSIALELAAGGLLLAAFALILWATYVDDADVSEPIYLWAMLLVVAGAACWTIPSIIAHPKRTVVVRRIVVGAFLFMYAMIVLAIALDALDGDEDWRSLTLSVVFAGVVWASWSSSGSRLLNVPETIIEIALVILVFISVPALLGLIVYIVISGGGRDTLTETLAAPHDFLVHIVLPTAAMLGGLEIAKRLDCRLGADESPSDKCGAS